MYSHYCPDTVGYGVQSYMIKLRANHAKSRFKVTNVSLKIVVLNIIVFYCRLQLHRPIKLYIFQSLFPKRSIIQRLSVSSHHRYHLVSYHTTQFAGPRITNNDVFFYHFIAPLNIVAHLYKGKGQKRCLRRSYRFIVVAITHEFNDQKVDFGVKRDFE